MLPEKPKRDYRARVRRKPLSRQVLLLGIVLTVLLFFPLTRSSAGGMNGEQWVDLALVMVMFCCTIAILYQLGLSALDRGLRELRGTHQQPDDKTPEHDIFNR